MESSSRPAYKYPLELVQVHAFFRHGDRSPTPLGEAKARSELWVSRLQEVPTSLPQRDYFPQKFPWGLLTRKGADQARALGAWLREHYLPALCGPESLNDLESPERFIQLRSTNFLRTHLTGWFVLEGLLGSPKAAKSIPILCREEKDENLYHNEHCPRLAKRWKTAWMARRELVGPDGTLSTNWRTRFKDMQISMANGLEISEENPGFLLSMDKPGFPWVTAVDTLECGQFHGDPLPDGVSEAELTEVRRLLAHDYAMSFQDRDILQLSMGRLVREVMDVMVERIRSPYSPSSCCFSTRDMMPPLCPSQWPDWPQYTSSICMELWRSPGGGQHFVRVLYDGGEVALPLSREHEAPKKILLTLEEFQGLAKWSMISEADFHSQCPDSGESD